MRPNLGDNARPKGYVGDEVAVPDAPVRQHATASLVGFSHDIHVQPVGPLVHGAGTLGAELGKVGRQD